jgi:hypothetical protein
LLLPLPTIAAGFARPPALVLVVHGGVATAVTSPVEYESKLSTTFQAAVAKPLANKASANTKIFLSICFSSEIKNFLTLQSHLYNTTLHTQHSTQHILLLRSLYAFIRA